MNERYPEIDEYVKSEWRLLDGPNETVSTALQQESRR